MKQLLDKARRFLFFTGKGGVGKTSMASTVALGLADRGKRVLLISTDPASNLDEVLETALSSTPTPVKGVPGLQAVNINPMRAAEEYRERMVAPYRGVLPEAALRQMEEQLSGACTVEIAGFNEFSKFVGNATVVADYDHIVLDTAPTGHTLRLLNLPAAWNDFIADNQTGSSCLGPVSGLAEKQQLFAKVVTALKDDSQTLLVLVSRAEAMSLNEAERARQELGETGLKNQHLVINGVFTETSSDGVATAFSHKSRTTLDAMPAGLKQLAQTRVGFRPSGIMGISSLREVSRSENDRPRQVTPEALHAKLSAIGSSLQDWETLIAGLESAQRGVIMTMGKGGVGKTTMAALIATELARQGHSVLLSTTDPAAHVADVIGAAPPNLHVDRIDPKRETARYVDFVLCQNRNKLSADDLTLLEEELRSPCIEEIAVFQAFARTVAQGNEQFIVLDTAPTGHTLLLLDSTQAYHREVAKATEDLPEEVKELLPRIRDPEFTRVLIVAIPEATPMHEAAALQEDLGRAGIEPYGWIINRSFAVSGTTDPVLCAKGYHELPFMREMAESLADRCVVSPWIAEELQGTDNLAKLKNARPLISPAI